MYKVTESAKLLYMTEFNYIYFSASTGELWTVARSPFCLAVTDSHKQAGFIDNKQQ